MSLPNLIGREREFIDRTEKLKYKMFPKCESESFKQSLTHVRLNDTTINKCTNENNPNPK